MYPIRSLCLVTVAVILKIIKVVHVNVWVIDVLLTYSKTYCSGVTVASPRCFGSHSLLLRYLRVHVCVRGCVQQQGKIKDKKRKNEKSKQMHVLVATRQKKDPSRF